MISQSIDVWDKCIIVIELAAGNRVALLSPLNMERLLKEVKVMVESRRASCLSLFKRVFLLGSYYFLIF
jgi:hypothetical protein